MTGKIGLEAVSAGTPVVYLGQPWWSGMPGSFALKDLDNWEAVSGARTPAQLELEHWVDAQVSSRLLVGLGATTPEKYGSHTASLPKEYEQLEAQAIVAAIDTIWPEPSIFEP